MHCTKCSVIDHCKYSIKSVRSNHICIDQEHANIISIVASLANVNVCQNNWSIV